MNLWNENRLIDIMGHADPALLEGDFPVSGKITSRVLDKWKRIVSNRRYLVQKNGFDMVSKSHRCSFLSVKDRSIY